MNFWKRALPLAFVLFFAMLLAACASQATPPAGNVLPASPSEQATTASVQAAKVNVKGSRKTVLVDAQGNTLYYFTPDTRTASKCSGDCAGTWPAYLYSGSGTPTGSSDVLGELTVQATTN